MTNIPPVVDRLEDHRQEYTKELLAEHGLTKSGTWPELKKRLAKALRSGSIPWSAALDLLDRVESAGKQHVFLYDVDPNYADSLADQRLVADRLSEGGHADVLGARAEYIDLPDSPRLVLVSHSPNELRAKWVEKQTWYKRGEPDVRADGRRVIEEIPQEERNVIVLSVDLESAEVQLRIGVRGQGGRSYYSPIVKAQGSDYTPKVEEYQSRSQVILDWDNIEPVFLGSNLSDLLSSDEIRIRRGQVYTERESKVDLTSGRRDDDVRNDDFYQGGTEKTGLDRLRGKQINAWWKAADDNPLRKDVHTYIYVDANEVRFPADCSEQEMLYVLSRIREITGA